jgi:hypothetical protein
MPICALYFLDLTESQQAGPFRIEPDETFKEKRTYAEVEKILPILLSSVAQEYANFAGAINWESTKCDALNGYQYFSMEVHGAYTYRGTKYETYDVLTPVGRKVISLGASCKGKLNEDTLSDLRAIAKTITFETPSS